MIAKKNFWPSESCKFHFLAQVKISLGTTAVNNSSNKISNKNKTAATDDTTNKQTNNNQILTYNKYISTKSVDIKSFN